MSTCCSSSCNCNSSAQKTTELRIQDLKPGQSAKVRGYLPGHPTYMDKLLSMGVIRGTTFTVIRVAPMGDPIDLRIRNYHLTLRKDEAAILLLEAIV